MISISSVSFDLNGNVILPSTGRSGLSDKQRRVTRTATLDNEVVIADMGFSEGDRTLDVVAKIPSEVLEEAVYYLQKTYPLVILTCNQGGFLGVIADTRRRQSDLAISFLVKEKLTED